MNITALHKKLVSEKIISCSRPYLSKLVKKGLIPFKMEKEHRDYSFHEVVSALKNGVERSSNSLADKSGNGSDTTYIEAKIFLTIFQGKLAQQKFDIESGKLLYGAEVEKKAFTTVRAIRDQILILPERLASELASNTDKEDIEAILTNEIQNILEGLSLESLIH